MATPDEIRAKEATAWFLDRARRLSPNKFDPHRKILSPTDLFVRRRGVVTPLAGQMMMFRYHAKHADTLPYFDMFPLAFLLDVRDEGFLSLNLHYLHPDVRKQLLDSIIGTITDTRLDWRSKAKVTYQMVKNTSSLSIALPALKSHLFSQIRSKIVRIQPKDWYQVADLPVEAFTVSKYQVWADSAKRRRGRR